MNILKWFGLAQPSELIAAQAAVDEAELAALAWALRLSQRKRDLVQAQQKARREEACYGKP